MSYQPATSDLERLAYQAANAILAADFGEHATPGQHRSRKLDKVADLIIEAFDPEAYRWRAMEREHAREKVGGVCGGCGTRVIDGACVLRCGASA